MTIESKIVNLGSWLVIRIISVEMGHSMKMINGKWENCSAEPERFEYEILTLGKFFSTESAAESFLKTKQYKSLFNSIQKNWK